MHLVSLVTHRSGVTLSQRRVEEKAYEPDALCEMLEELDLTGMVVTMDALYTHADIAQKILDRGPTVPIMCETTRPLNLAYNQGEGEIHVTRRDQSIRV